MYEAQFVATTSADWAQSIELIDSTTNLPLDTTGATFELNVEGRFRDSVLSGSTDDGTVVSPETGVVQWTFPKADLSPFCGGDTYRVGLTMTTAGGTVQLVLGTLVILDGIVS